VKSSERMKKRLKNDIKLETIVELGVLADNLQSEK
jgi:hypothetical protein